MNQYLNANRYRDCAACGDLTGFAVRQYTAATHSMQIDRQSQNSNAKISYYNRIVVEANDSRNRYGDLFKLYLIEK